jgi:hypothetical protein
MGLPFAGRHRPAGAQAASTELATDTALVDDTGEKVPPTRTMPAKTSTLGTNLLLEWSAVMVPTSFTPAAGARWTAHRPFNSQAPWPRIRAIPDFRRSCDAVF